MDNPAQWMQLVNSAGFPLIAIYSFMRGWVVTGREFETTVANHHASQKDLKDRCDRLEKKLDETQAMVVRILSGDVTPGSTT